MLCTQCAAPTQWRTDRLAGTASQHKVYLSKKALGGIDVELLQMEGAWLGYLTVKKGALPAESDLLLQGELFRLSVYEGGQKAKLPEEAVRKMIQDLQEGVGIDMIVPGYHERLEPL